MAPMSETVRTLRERSDLPQAGGKTSGKQSVAWVIYDNQDYFEPDPAIDAGIEKGLAQGRK